MTDSLSVLAMMHVCVPTPHGSKGSGSTWGGLGREEVEELAIDFQYIGIFFALIQFNY